MTSDQYKPKLQAEPGKCDCCEKDKQVIFHTKETGASICVKCLNVFSQAAELRPTDSIYCFACKSHLGIKLHFNENNITVDVELQEVDKGRAIYGIQSVSGKWSKKQTPIKFTCLSCSSGVAPWVVFTNSFMVQTFVKHPLINL